MHTCAALLVLCAFVNKVSGYEPTWDSLDTRPLPSWYDDAKIGIFMHWGVYSVPSFGSKGGTSTEWFWAYWRGGNEWHKAFMKRNYPQGFTYEEFAKDFKAEFYNPKNWAKLFQKSGARYVVLTSKHHDGYTLWPSTYAYRWNARDVGPHRDVVGELADAIRRNTDLRFGLYYSLYEWYHPLYLSDREGHFKKNTFILNKVYPEMVQIVEDYLPEVLWADGDWEACDTYFLSREFLAWLYNDSPVKDKVVVNDRWGKRIPCRHGDFYTCKDRFNPGVLQSHKWENAMTIDKDSWGFRRNADLDDYLTTKQILVILAQTISCGGNILINVGPTSDGRIVPIFEERLLDVGNWLSINGEAIYSSRPWQYQNDTIGNAWYTSKPSTVYAIVLDWPTQNLLVLSRVTDLFETEEVNVTVLGNPGKLKWDLSKDRVEIKLPDKATLQSRWTWVVKIERVNAETLGRNNSNSHNFVKNENILICFFTSVYILLIGT